MVEDGLAPGVDVAQKMVGEIVPRWKKAAEQTFKVRYLLNCFAVPIFELRRIRQKADTEEQRAFVDAIEGMAGRCKDGEGLYLKFMGD